MPYYFICVYMYFSITLFKIEITEVIACLPFQKHHIDMYTDIYVYITDRYHFSVIHKHSLYR